MTRSDPRTDVTCARIPWDQPNDCPAIVVDGVGTVDVVRSAAPSVVGRVDFTRRVTRTAPSTFSWPAPCWSMLRPAIGCAVYIRIALTRFGVSFGFVWSMRATAPDTTGV